MSTITEIVGDFDDLEGAIRQFRDYAEVMEATPHRPSHDCGGLDCEFCESEEVWAMARSALSDIERFAEEAYQRIGVFAAEEWS